MSKASGHWLISTQVDPVTKVALPGVLPSTKTDALCFLDKAYADAGAKGGNFFRGPQGPLAGGLWGAVLYKDRNIGSNNPARAAAVVAYYKPWLPPWDRAAAPAASRPSRKRSRS